VDAGNANRDLPGLCGETARRIEARVRELETKTSVEFVPMVVERSSDFDRERFLVALVVAFVALAIAQHAFWTGSSWVPVGLSIGAGLAVFFVSRFSFGLRLFVPASWRRASVEAAAREAFVRHQVFATRARTGLLIYVAWLERSVLILADRGLTERVPEEEFGRLGSGLASDLARQGSGGSVLSALDAAEALLVRAFPPDASNPNELGDELRRR